MSKTIYQSRLENLQPARDHFRVRAESIRKYFPFEIWSKYGLNWPQWDKLRVLVCNTFGVSTVDQIPDELIDDANVFTISLIDQMFEQNIKVMHIECQKRR